jgi:hypothetical protein
MSEELAVVVAPPVEEPAPEPAIPSRPSLREWAQDRWRLLCWIIIGLLIPYLLACYAITAVMLRGSCGG